MLAHQAQTSDVSLQSLEKELGCVTCWGGGLRIQYGIRNTQYEIRTVSDGTSTNRHRDQDRDVVSTTLPFERVFSSASTKG